MTTTSFYIPDYTKALTLRATCNKRLPKAWRKDNRATTNDENGFSYGILDCAIYSTPYQNLLLGLGIDQISNSEAIELLLNSIGYKSKLSKADI